MRQIGDVVSDKCTIVAINSQAPGEFRECRSSLSRVAEQDMLNAEFSHALLDRCPSAAH